MEGVFRHGGVFIFRQEIFYSAPHGQKVYRKVRFRKNAVSSGLCFGDDERTANSKIPLTVNAYSKDSLFRQTANMMVYTVISFRQDTDFSGDRHGY